MGLLQRVGEEPVYKEFFGWGRNVKIANLQKITAMRKNRCLKLMILVFFFCVWEGARTGVARNLSLNVHLNHLGACVPKAQNAHLGFLLS